MIKVRCLYDNEYREENAYNVYEFDYIHLSFSVLKNGKFKYEYIELPITFDIETSTIYDKAKSINEVEDLIDSYQKNYREHHIKRLYNGLCNAYEGAIFLDLITDLERIGDHSTNIAESVINNSIEE